MRGRSIRLSLILALSGCASAGTLPATLGEQASGFGYIPLDGLGVAQWPDDQTCDTIKKKWRYGPLLNALPDLSVRFAVATLGASGTVVFGPAKVTAERGTYRAVLDYVNVDVVPVRFFLRVRLKHLEGYSFRGLAVPVQSPGRDSIIGYDALVLDYEDARKLQDSLTQAGFDQVTIPIYVGIGMRLSADIRALKAGVGLTSLGAIAAAAEANALSGTLTVQTLGITGRSVATVLPLPSKLDQTTVENSILALGSSRALIYGGDTTAGDVTMTPRVVGLYSPVGSDPRLINAIYSQLAEHNPPWRRPCTNVEQTATGSTQERPK